MPIDHFNKTDLRTFRLRYLINTKYVQVKNNPPIFFYSGDNAYAEDNARDNGYIWELAQHFGAILIIAEHRFYGKSSPFGNVSFTSVDYLKYLNSKQALEDYVNLINYIKYKRLENTKNSKIISFGYGYGGELTVRLRVKYPLLINGGVASSAPVHFYVNVSSNPRPDLKYSSIVTNVLNKNGCKKESLYNSFENIRNLSKTINGRQYLNDKFKFSNISKINSTDDGELLIYNVLAIFDLMAKVNYPYSTSLKRPLPAWPIKEACKPFLKAKTSEEYILASYEVLNLWNNYTGKYKEINLWDFSPPSEAGDTDGWDWQTCTEVIFPMCSVHGAPFDPFDKGNCYYNETEYLNNCLKVYSSIGYTKEMFDPYFVQNNYGYEWPNASNIIFSNGNYDPWSAGR
uniref:Uncharacterized protein n=1 Tax=Meloidogyne incognita TaxID=6306 RepID=A0A914KSR4_MELIC